jgi:ABC-type phosphate transport system substrate-binding protein
MRGARLTLLALLLPLLWLPHTASAANAQGMVVVVNPGSHIRSLTREQVIDIFMGRFRQLPSGATALPIDVADVAVRQTFYERLVHKSLAEIGSYWARLVFSGQASPPFRAPDTRTALELVATNPDAIAYCDRASVTGQRVRVVLDLEP